MEPENYLDVALAAWLPRRWERADYESALQALAALFEERHHDPWLRDLLAARRSERLVRSQKDLAAAVEANLSDETDVALTKSAEAARGFRAEGNRAGALRAEFEQTYALHRNLASAAQCVSKAVMLEHEAEPVHYSWIVGQGNCRSLLGDYGPAHQDMARALSLISRAGYHDIELRQAGILANVQTSSGNLLAAWSVARDGLSKYWNGPFQGIRAQQIYFNLMHSAESLELPWTAYAFEKAAASAIAQTQRRRTEATVRAHLAELAVEVGDRGEARNEFERAGRLFDQLWRPSDQRYRILAELSLAQAELADGAPQSALKRLQAIAPAVERMDAVLRQIQYQQLLGDAFSLTGKLTEAETAYQVAINLCERRLDTFRGFRDRAQLMLVSGRAYRGAIELLWNRGDEAGALRLWEWFRAAEGSDRRPDLEQRRMQLRSESFVTYSMLPDGPVAWLFDNRGIEAVRLTTDSKTLQTAASRFLRECSEPGSDLQALNRDARQLYDWLIAPLAGSLDPGRTLVIEPDGAIGQIPIQALLDSKFRYLGDRFAIVIAGGLADYQLRAVAAPVDARVKALVVASPALGEDASKTFPHLEGTSEEGESVANRFHAPVFLSEWGATLGAVEQYRPVTELFHFAGHGFSNNGNGGLLLSPGRIDVDEPGILDGARMAKQDWSRCRLAVLAACSSGTGEEHGPVNPESLVRGLLWAGVSRVVASRWNVESDSGVKFMDRFYTHLLAGKDAAAALQFAARAVRTNQVTSHPYFWAGFQDFGAR